MKIIVPFLRKFEKNPNHFLRIVNKKEIYKHYIENAHKWDIPFDILSDISEIEWGDFPIVKLEDYSENGLNTQTNVLYLNPNFLLLKHDTIHNLIDLVREGYTCILNQDESVIASVNLDNLLNSGISGENVIRVKLTSIEDRINLEEIDNWWKLDYLLKRKKILLHPMSKNKLGTGHIFRSMTLANYLCIKHEVIFLLEESQDIGISVIGNSNFPFFVYKQDPLNMIMQLQPDIIINDLLNTSVDYMKRLKELNIRIINFEDMGEGAELADAVINALYPGDVPSEKFFTGEKFYCMREDFYGVRKKEVNKEVSNILITYGGEDPSFLTQKTLKGIIDARRKFEYIYQIDIILGPAFRFETELNNYLGELLPDEMNIIRIHKNIKNMADFMYKADIIFTSAGRTMYEIATVGTPAVVSAQNYRELTHTFGHPYNGFYNLGYGNILTSDDFLGTLHKLVEDFELRKVMNSRMISLDFSKGIKRVEKIILGDIGNEEI